MGPFSETEAWPLALDVDEDDMVSNVREEVGLHERSLSGPTWYIYWGTSFVHDEAHKIGLRVAREVERHTRAYHAAVA